MFNLVISIIAIALVVALAGASLFYGGDAFKNSKKDADIAELTNKIEQIRAAHTIYKVETGGIISNGLITNTSRLVSEGYIKELTTPDHYHRDSGTISKYFQLTQNNDGKKYIVMQARIDDGNTPSFSTFAYIDKDLCDHINTSSSDIFCYQSSSIGDALQFGNTNIAEDQTQRVVIGKSL